VEQLPPASAEPLNVPEPQPAPEMNQAVPPPEPERPTEPSNTF
jgi:hypothetical protein